MEERHSTADEKQNGNPAFRSNGGFSLVEVVVALLIIMIGLLGVFTVFTYAIVYNSGNKSRAQALQILQQEVEQIRAARFNQFIVDPVLQGGVKPRKTVTAADGFVFTVDVSVDNDPFVAQVQDDSHVCRSPQNAAVPCTLKEITVLVRLAAPSPGWQTAVPATVVLRRVRGN